MRVSLNQVFFNNLLKLMLAPVQKLGFALIAGHRRNLLVRIERIVAMARRGDFLKDHAVLCTESMHYASGHPQRVARFQRLALAVDHRFHRARKYMKSLVLALMKMLRIPLARQLDDQFFRILAVEALHDRTPYLIKTINPVVMRELHGKIMPHRNPRFIEHAFYRVDGMIHDFLARRLLRAQRSEEHT